MTYFESPDGKLVKVRDVREGDQVQSASGSMLQVAQAEHLGPQPHWLVRLRTRDATLAVTETHRVLCRRVSGFEAVPANSLRLGHDVVITNFEIQVLIAVERFEATIPVSRLTFSPDAEVNAYLPNIPTRTILSRGHRERGFRRGH